MLTLEKRSSEQVRYDIDCSLLLASGETISSVSALSAEPVTAAPIAFGTPVVNSASVTYVDASTGNSRIAPIGTVVQVQISGGSIAAGQQWRDYVLRCKLITSVNPLVEATVRLRVNDTP